VTIVAAVFKTDGTDAKATLGWQARIRSTAPPSPAETISPGCSIMLRQGRLVRLGLVARPVNG
jgi:hypothetical protein